MDSNFEPELMTPGYYMLCPLRKGKPVPEDLLKVQCPQCNRDCVLDPIHAQHNRWKDLTVKCLHCMDRHGTPTPNN